MTSRQEIKQAAERIAPYLRVTPVIELPRGGFGYSGPLTLKLELLQCTGSFKPRGAFNKILSSTIPSAGVIAASGGNHGAAVAYAARELGAHAEIFVPEISSPVKVARLRDYGAEVTVTGADYIAALAACNQRALETGALAVHAYNQPEVIAGQGTTGLELAQQASQLDSLLVACGGGGFVAGIAAWFRGDVRVIAVEPARAPSLATALAEGRPIDVEVGGIAADSLGARSVGELAFEIAQNFIERVVLVEDDAIRAAQHALWNELRVIAEPGGAAALAALHSGAYRPAPGERVGVLVCGGNTDPATIC
jgi:threonine dehydratase